MYLYGNYREVKVNKSTVADILKGRTWSNITGIGDN